MNRVLEATNSSLRQQLSQKITQLGQREEDLQGSRRKLAQSQETLQVEQKAGQATRQQLQACQSDGEKTKEALRNKETERMNLEQRLNSMQERLQPFFKCSTPGICSGKGEMGGPAMTGGLNRGVFLQSTRHGRPSHDGWIEERGLSIGVPLSCSGKGW